jgi:hypothetical protein
VKATHYLLFLLPFLIIACGLAGSAQVPVAELPDPSIYALTIPELPKVGFPWQQTYNQTTTEEGYKWAYEAYQAYHPGSLGVDLESGFAINNDVVLYETDVSQQDLPQPPQSIGDIKDISWISVAQTQRLGDKSQVWKATIGDLLTPVWWLEFYQGHAYIRISLLGFPDQIAPAYLYGLGDIVSSRLPRSVEALRTDSATQVATQPSPTPLTASNPGAIPSTQVIPEGTPQASLIPLNYTAPAGGTGMVAFVDDTGNQLTDGSKGTDDIMADQGLGTAYEWVGWTMLTEPVTMTFSFEGDTSIASVEIGLYHREGLGVYVPVEVTINGVDFSLSSDEVPNNQRQDVVFNGPFNGPQVQVVLYHRGRGWILVDEVHFTPEE